MKQIYRRLSIAAAALAVAFLVSPLVNAQAAKVDVTGKWTFSVETGAGSGTPTLTFKQEGEKLSGHYSSATLGEADFTGSVKGQNITFSFPVDAQGVQLQVTYTGTVESKDAMKGKVVLGELGEGTFTGKRQ